MPVDVLHRYRRQVSALPHSRAEMGHHQRVGTELIKEVAIDRHAVDAQDVSEHLGEDAFGAGRRGAAPILDQHGFSHCPTHTRSRNSTAASEPCATCSSHGLLEEVGHALLCPLAIAWSYTHVPTARSRIPMPKGAKMIGRPRFTVVIRS